MITVYPYGYFKNIPKAISIENFTMLHYAELKYYGGLGYIVVGAYEDLINPGMKASYRYEQHKQSKL